MDKSNRIVTMIAMDNEKFVSEHSFTKRRFIKNSLSQFLSAMLRFGNASAIYINKNVHLTPINTKK